jgi:DNA topoisomerase-3
MIPSVKGAIAGLPGEYAPLSAPLLENFPIMPRVYNDAKVTDHHAIITTGKRPPANLPEPERKLYGLVAKRLLAAHYPDYQYEAAKVITRVNGHDFLSTGVTPLVEGWRAVYRGEPSNKPSKNETPLPGVKTGDERPVKSVNMKKNKTKPPDRLTDATLLRAMEAAGRELADDELRESMKESGLGTPATRAAIIERLIGVGYLVRSGKSLISTDKGDKLISIVPDEMRSPEMTGRWEKALAGIARAIDAEALGAQKGRFIDGIRRFASFIVGAAFTAPSKVTFEPENFKRK